MHHCKRRQGLDRATFGRLRDRYGDHATWAVWAERDERRGTGPWVGDLSVLDLAGDPTRLAPLHRCVVLVALTHGPRRDGVDIPEPWSTLHDPTRLSRDFMLADATRGTPFWGSYVTAFFKNLPRHDGAGLADHLEDHPGKEAEDVAVLRQELAEIGGYGGHRPLLVCLGAQVAPYVELHLGAEYDVRRVSTYSRVMTRGHYQREFADLADRIRVPV